MHRGPLGASDGYRDRAAGRILGTMGAEALYPAMPGGSTPMGEVSLEGRFLRVNRALADLLGRAPEELIELGPLAVTHPADRDRIISMLDLMRAGSIGNAKFRERLVAADGNPIEVLISGSVIHGEDGAPTAFGFTIQTTAAPARQSEWDNLFLHSRHGIAVVDADGRHARVNDAYAAMLGYTPADLRGLPWRDIVPADCTPELEQAHAEMLRQGGAWLETLGLRGDGSCFEAEIELVTNHDGAGVPAGHLCLLRDVSARGTRQFPSGELLSADRAGLDGLTGLPDAASFLERLEHGLSGRDEPSLAVLVIGMEARWPEAGRTGRSMQVDVRRAIAERIAMRLGSGGFLARLGDWSFGILLASRDELTVAAKTRWLLKATSEPVLASGEPHEVHSTVGIAVASPGDHPLELIDMADQARRRARELGSDRFELVDSDESRPDAPARQLSDDIREALRGDQLRLRYQPLFDLSDRSICGVEALLRWEHPSRTVLSPDLFLASARRTGAIFPIGRWVLDQALHQLERWNEELTREKPLRLFVNLCARQLADPSLVDTMAAAIERTGVAPAQLAIDISDALLAVHGPAWHSVVGLRELGAVVVLDRFGTALSSLADLERLPIDLVKLDRSCVAGVADDGHDRAIVKATLGVAEANGLGVIACGVETEAQALAVAELGCRSAQGFLFSEPRAERAVTKLLRWTGERGGGRRSAGATR